MTAKYINMFPALAQFSLMPIITEKAKQARHSQVSRHVKNQSSTQLKYLDLNSVLKFGGR